MLHLKWIKRFSNNMKKKSLPLSILDRHVHSRNSFLSKSIHVFRVPEFMKLSASEPGLWNFWLGINFANRLLDAKDDRQSLWWQSKDRYDLDKGHLDPEFEHSVNLKIDNRLPCYESKFLPSWNTAAHSSSSIPRRPASPIDHSRMDGLERSTWRLERNSRPKS